MTILEALLMAWRDIMRAKLRSFLTMLGVIIGIFAVISLVTLGEGMKGYVYKQVGELGTGPTYMEVHPGKEGQFAAMATVKLTLSDAQAIAERCSTCVSVDPRNIQSGKLEYRGRSSTSPIIMGATEALVDQMNWGVGQGRFISRRL